MSKSGGNNDGGAGARAEEDRQRKAAATRDVNRIFGIDSGAATDRPGPAKGGDDSRGQQWDRERAAEQEVLAKNKAGREAMYEKNKDDVFDFNKSELDEDFAKSDRELRFALARAGLSGGSVEVDDKDKQNLAYDKGILTSKSYGEDAAAKFRGADENARLDVINQIQSGVDSGSAISSAQRGLDISADKADAAIRGQALGDVFADAGLLYNKNQRDQGTIDARNTWNRNNPGLIQAPSTSGTVRRR